MGEEKLKWHQLTYNHSILVHAVQLKPMIKALISGRMASIGISDVVTASVYLEKIRLKKFMMMVMNKSQEMTVYHGRQKLTSAKKLRLEKCDGRLQI